MEIQKVVIIDNVRSAHNVGSIFRTAEGAGVSQIILCGYTPTPIDRFGRIQPEIAKTSLGASAMIPWEQKITPEEITVRIDQLKKEGFSIVAVEQTPESVSLYDFTLPAHVAYILGNEIDGVSPLLLEKADTVVEIPMAGKKESLNVSVAAGIALFHM